MNIRDQAMGASEVLKNKWVDTSRVAVWGWSGGGSSTLSLLMQYPQSYPNRSHSISEGEGTSRHLATTFTRFLKENCLPRRPAASWQSPLKAPLSI